MNIIRLKDDILVYSFDGEKYDVNILALITGDLAFLIDAGTQEYASQLKIDLQEKEVKVDKILFSQAHSDHIEGRNQFSKVEFLSSEFFSQVYVEKVENSKLDPISIQTVEHNEKLKIGKHHLKFLNLPGHSKESLVTIVDRQFLHIGDLLIFTNSGQYCLPFLDHYPDALMDHLQSLKFLQTLTYSTIIPSHGQIMMDHNQFHDALHRAIFYLEKLSEKGRNAKVEDCIFGNLADYVHYDVFHANNVKNTFQ